MEALTPMMEQYLRIKEHYNDAILLFRLGDFYEMFFDDAIEASKILGITLTTRNKNDQNPVPLCGVPYHSVQPYITKLLQASKRVAICDQVEDPAEAKGVVRREVTRVVTPGVVVDHDALPAKEYNYLAALLHQSGLWSLAACDISTGRFQVGSCSSKEEVLEELFQLEPRELLLSQALHDDVAPALKTRFPALLFTVVDAAGDDAAALIRCYLEQTQFRTMEHLRELTPLRPQHAMRLDETTKRNLELTRTMRDGERYGSLLWLLDRTKTAMGGRLLREWILEPLVDRCSIEGRQAAVGELIAHHRSIDLFAEELAHIYDLERLVSRVSLGHANARDVVALRNSLAVLPRLKSLGSECGEGAISALLHGIDELADLHAMIAPVLVDDPPFSVRDGGVIKSGVNAELDELRAIAASGKDVIVRMEEAERKRTGIGSLKVKFNRVFGYFIEVTHVHREKIPSDYIRKQTLVNAERYITPDLKAYEDKVLGSEEKSKLLEYRLFEELKERLAAEVSRLLKVARSIAELDVLVSLAAVAVDYRYTKPAMTDGCELDICEGRHPIIERLLQGKEFIPNDVRLSDETGRMMIITGPNMSGKSTVMRQSALIVLMAQIGSWVPAKQATIGIVDRIFTRVGASDALAFGQSTFMVEMSEAAVILNAATERSLVIVDEIGRGTSTFDGLAIAWAIAEDLHDRLRARTLFATHYHELVDLGLTKLGIRNMHIAVEEDRGEVIFLHRLVPGGTSRSYGLWVAKLAGFPEQLLLRAAEVLENLEKGEFNERGEPKLASRSKARKPDALPQISLFPNSSPDQ